ncbi:MAG: TlpA disulfide reductase family protein [Chitinophagaceae bacterium]
MKNSKILILIFFFYSNHVLSQATTKSLCEIFLDTRGLNINRDKATLELYKSQPDSVQKTQLIKSITGLKSQFKISFKIDTPFNGFFRLKNFDTLYDASSDLFFSNETIKCIISKKDGFVINSKQNNFLSENRFLLFDPPNELARQKGFLIDPLLRSSELNDRESFILEVKIKEYERNVIKQVLAYKDYFHTVRRLSRNRRFLSPATLEKCVSILYPIHKNTLWISELKYYVDNLKKLKVGNSVLSFNVVDQNGISIQSSTFYSKHEFTLLDFWASWCGPCREKMKKLRAIYDKIDTTKFKIISISIDENKDRWITAMKQDSINWENYIDPKGESRSISKKFNLDYIPANFLINTSGKIIQLDIWDDKLIAFLKEKNFFKN